MHFKGIELEGGDWIPLSQDMDKRLTLLSTVMNLRISDNDGIFRLGEQPFNSVGFDGYTRQPT
jgi:hypothetical protein